MFGLFKKISVYCQDCGKDLTDEGGVVTNNGMIFCAHISYVGLYSRCMASYIFNNSLDVSSTDCELPEMVQRKIREGKITHFNKLEKATSEVKR